MTRYTGGGFVGGITTQHWETIARLTCKLDSDAVLSLSLVFLPRWMALIMLDSLDSFVLRNMPQFRWNSSDNTCTSDRWYDILHPDIELFVKKASAADVQMTLIEAPELRISGTTGFTDVIPEAGQGQDTVVTAVKVNANSSIALWYQGPYSIVQCHLQYSSRQRM